MNIKLGCKCWSRGQQYGFRIYAPGIRSLVPHLAHPSADARWSCLADFHQQVMAGRHPLAYSRRVTISDGSRMIEATATIATHGRSVQGYITAPLDSWLRDYVESRLSENVVCEYLVQPQQDLILIPVDESSLLDKLEQVEATAKSKVRRRLRQMRYGPPPNAKEIGLYFEIMEFERLMNQFPAPDWRVHHRYPAIDSAVPFLRQNNVSCDIDVVTGEEEVVYCVEVKSVSGAPGSAFNLTRREWNSREVCRRSEIPYDIVVYYHARCQVIERLVISAIAELHCEPSGYWCFPT